MSLTQINNGDSGLDARGKINDAFAEVDTLSSTSWSSTGTGDTSDDTETTIWSWTIQSPTTQTGFNAMTVRASVVGYHPNSGGKAYGAELFGTFYAQNGTASYQVGTTDVFEKTSFSTATSHLKLDDDGTIIFTVTGEDSTYIKWNAEFRTMMTDFID
jgi:hypothetical protein